MEHNAVLTGSPERVNDVAIALKEAGYAVTKLDCLERLDETRAILRPGSVDAYVQLPWDVRPSDTGAVTGVHEFLAGGLLARFRVTRELLPLVRPGGHVVLVAGHRPADPHTPDDIPARRSLLHLLARAIDADVAGAGVRTSVVAEHSRPEEIAHVLRRGDAGQAPSLSRYAAYGENLSFADWRNEILAWTSELGS